MKDKNGKEISVGVHVTFTDKTCCDGKERLGTVTGINGDTVSVLSLSEDNMMCYEFMVNANEIVVL